MTDLNCIFCKIIDGKIPSPRVLENDHVIAIRDLSPQAKHHFLVIPKKHIASLEEAFQEDASGRETTGNLFSAANEIARKEDFLSRGFRSVINTGTEGGQTVFHLHLHLLGGENLKGSFGR